MRADRIEPVVWGAAVNAVTKPRILTNHILQVVDEINEGRISIEQRGRELVRRKEDIAFKKKRLDDLYFKGLKSIEDYEKQIAEFQAEESEVERELYEIRNMEEQIIQKSLILKGIKHLCDLAGQKIKSLNLEQKRTFLRHVIEEISLNSNTGEAKITGYVPIKKQDFEDLFSQVQSKNPAQMRPLSTPWRDYGQWSNNHLKFELEVRVLQ